MPTYNYPGITVKEFIAKTEKLVPGGMVYDPPGRAPGRGKILSYRMFIYIVSKYAHRTHPKLTFSNVDPPVVTDQYVIEFVGTKTHASLHPRRVFTLPLNDALLLGVQPEQVERFRRHYKLDAASEDALFFQIPLTID